jgi:hypothetical protein
MDNIIAVLRLLAGILCIFTFGFFVHRFVMHLVDKLKLCSAIRYLIQFFRTRFIKGRRH